MSEENNRPDAVDVPEPTGQPTGEWEPEAAAQTTQQTPKTRLRDRAFGIRGLAAVAVASLILGGVGGAAIAAVAAGDGRHDGPGRGGPMGMHRDGPSGQNGPDERFRGAPPGGFRGGELPPATPPGDEQDPGASQAPGTTTAPDQQS